MRHCRKLLWTPTLLFVALTAAFLIAFDPTPVSALPTGCVVDRNTGIAFCGSTVPENQRGIKISETCKQQTCKDAGGSLVKYGQSSDIYCWSASPNFTCAKTSGAVPSQSAQPPDQTSIATTSGTTAITLQEIRRQQTAAVKDCEGFLNLKLGCWINQTISTVINLVAGLLDLVVGSIAALMKFLSGLLQSALNEVIRYFVSIPVSPSNDNAPEFVKQAWNFTRGFVNNFFILILAFIGLATILRLEAYQLKKTLPALLLVALLVNFSGVLVGLVADVGNIITTSFLDLAKDPTWSMKDMPAFGGTNASAKLGIHIVEIIYYFVSTLIYLGVMLAFGLRTIVLWTLAIVSPLAFAAYILPATRGLATGWWKQLIQWALFGIPLSFFIFLASQVIQYGATPKGITAPGALGDFLAPFTTLFLLFAGITMSMAMAPAGAQGAINLGRSMPGRIAKTRLGAKALAGTAAGTQRFLGGTSGLHTFLQNKVPGGKVIATGMRWSTKPANRLAGGKLIEYAASKRKWQPPKNWDQMSTFEQESYITAQGLGSEDLVQSGAKMGKNLKYTSKAFRDKILGARDKTAQSSNRQGEIAIINDIFPESVTKNITIQMEVAVAVDKIKAKKDAEDKISKVAGEIQDEMKDNQKLRAEIQTDYLEKGKTLEDLAAAKIYAQKLKPQDIPNVINPKTLAFRLAMRDSSPENLQRIQDNFDHATLQDMFQGTGGLDAVMATRDQFDEFAQRNPRMARALFTNPAFIALSGEARGKMRDVRGRPTNRYNVYESRLQVKRLIRDEDKGLESKLSQVYAAFQKQYILQDQVRKLEETIREEQRMPGGGDISKIREGEEELRLARVEMGEINSALKQFSEEVVTEPDPKKEAKMQELWKLLSERRGGGRRGGGASP